MFGWWVRQRRRRLLAGPFPVDWRQAIEREVGLWHAVPAQARGKLENDLRCFVAERSWEACGGLELTAPMRAIIAAQACILTLGRNVDAFDHVRSIIVYPHAFWAPEVYEDDAGIVTEELTESEGEAWQWGTVVLSWQEVLRDARSLNGRNLVLHEMAHQLDLLDVLEQAYPGGGDEQGLHRRWIGTFLEAFDDFTQRVDSGRRVKALDAYGAEDEAEFFAVATESFFERGGYLKNRNTSPWHVGDGWPVTAGRQGSEGYSGEKGRVTAPGWRRALSSACRR